jgi:hypothetical protein
VAKKEFLPNKAEKKKYLTQYGVMLNKKRARKAAKSIEISGFLGSFAFMRQYTHGNLCKNFSAPKTAKCRKKRG